MFSIHWHRYPYLFFLISLTAGILVSSYLSCIPSPTLLGIILSTFILLLTTRKIKSGIFFCTITFIILFFTGVYNNRPDLPPYSAGERYLLKGRCEQILSPGKGIISSRGLNIYIQVPDTLNFTVGDSLSFMARLYPLTSTSNYHEFDYNNYLRHQGIHARAILSSPVTRTGHSGNIHSYCHSIQSRLTNKLTNIVPDSTTRDLLTALCLGSRQDLGPDIKKLFQATGTVHLLAISGLHMGAIYLLLLYILHLCNIRNIKYELILIPLIWFIAGVTGLSPSACRAATILSFITIGKVFVQDYIPLNAIAAAAFYSLLIQPDILYSISFQMSYSAYIGIILIYPRIMFSKKNMFPPARWIYSLFCASIAAQVMTLPITAYYFHTINLNSFIINLAAVPAATYLLYSGVFLLVLPNAIGAYLAYISVGLTHALLFCLQSFYRIAINIPDFYPIISHVLIIYTIMILAIVYSFIRKRGILTALCYTTGILLLFTCGYSRYQHSRQEIVILNRYNHSTIIFNYKGYYSFLKNTDKTVQIPPYITANHLKALPAHEGFTGNHIQYSSNQLRTPEHVITIIDSIHPDIYPSGILIVTENTYPAPLHPEMSLQLKQIILDHSNSPRCIKAWEEFSTRHHIPFFRTNVLGPVTFPLE